MKNRNSFTMSEILISLTIIGVIAAITLPALRANINEKAWATQRKALYSRMSQAVTMLPSLNGYGEYAGTWNNNAVTVTKDTATATFIMDGLSKVLKIDNICTVTRNMSSNDARKELNKCGISSKYIKWGENKKTNFPTKLSEFNSWWVKPFEPQFINPQKNVDTRVGAFTTKNGESIAVFYNPKCLTKDVILPTISDRNIKNAHSVMPYLCASFIFDLNGLKGPNKLGKDMWYMTALYSTDTELTMIPPEKFGLSSPEIKYNQALRFCADNNSRLPNKEETISLSYYYDFAGVNAISLLMQGATASLGDNYTVYMYITTGSIAEIPKTLNGAVFRVVCLKR